MKKMLIYSALVAVIYFILNYLYLSFFHLHEDAYIMFRYVEMFVQGYGITYYPGGEPTEGATDFLWFILLSILRFLHIDVGIASVILNTIGVFMITFFITNIIGSVKDKKTGIILFPFTFLWLFLVPILASFGGFSVFSYCGFILLILHLLNKKTAITSIPLLSIVIALFRPDGVILGVCFTFIGLYLCRKEEMKKYVISMIAAFFIGVVYFIWRYTYFGELLPLPLYVKQSADIWYSLTTNMNDIIGKGSVLGVILFVLCFLLQTKENKKKIFILTLPLLILFTIFSLAHQSQNIALRFQAPIMYMGYYLIVVMIVNIVEQKSKMYVYLCILIFYVQIITSVRTTTYLYGMYSYVLDEGTYLNVFPKKMSKYILEDGDTFALTEAGRLAYWLDKPVKIIDLVGLNTKYTAKHRLTQEYFKEIDPDAIMILIHLNFKGDKNVYWIKDKEEGRKAMTLDKDKLHLYEADKAGQAMIETGQYLYDHWDEYDVFFVRFLRDSHLHLYAIKKDKHKSELLYKLLDESFGDPKSYLDLKKEEK